MRATVPEPRNIFNGLVQKQARINLVMSGSFGVSDIIGGWEIFRYNRDNSLAGYLARPNGASSMAYRVNFRVCP